MAPVTRWKPEYRDVPWMVEIPDEGGLTKRSVVDLFQVRSMSTRRCVEKIGAIDEQTMETIERQLCRVFGVKTFPEGER